MVRQFPKESFFRRHATTVVWVFALLTPVMGWAALRAVRSNSNSVLDWLPSSYSETKQLAWFRQHFQSDGFVVISWEGCRLGGNPDKDNALADDPRIERLAATLEQQTAAARGRGEVAWCESVTTGRRLISQLTADPLNLPYRLAIERLQGVIIGPDERQTCVIATYSRDALDQMRQVLGRPHATGLGVGYVEGQLFETLRECGIDAQQVRLGGPPVDNVAIDEEGERTLLRLAMFSGLVGLILSGYALRDFRLTMIVFACGLFCAAASLAAVWVTGSRTDAVLMSMPALVYVLSISGAIHIVNYYQTEVRERGYVDAAQRALAHAWRPALFCTSTTAFGLLSLYTSELTPIRKFGIYSALGTVIAMCVLFLFLPAALERWPMRTAIPAKTRRRKHESTDGSNGEHVIARPSRDILGRICWGIISHYRLVTAACLAAIVAVGIGVTRVETTVDLMKLFGGDAQILKDYRWLESHVGELVPVEIVVRFPHETLHRAGTEATMDGSPDVGTFTILERMELVSKLQSAIAEQFAVEGGGRIVGPSISAVTFVPPLPKERRGTSALFRRSATNAQYHKHFDALLQSGYLKTDSADGAELWRVSLRVAAFCDVDYAQFTKQLREVVQPVIETQYARVVQRQAKQAEGHAVSVTSSVPVEAIYTGVVPIVYKAQRALLDSLIESVVWSFVSITPLLMFVSRGVRAGMVAMLPNALPVLTVFGGMGWLGQPVDIGSMMSASIALGVAVDDTIHYLTWFRDELAISQSRNEAIVGAYRRCAVPTLQAALISGFGLSVFAFSTFTPTKKFGYLMLTILIAGVIAELVMLPALLAGPLGAVFTRSSARRGSLTQLLKRVTRLPAARRVVRRHSARSKASSESRVRLGE